MTLKKYQTYLSSIFIKLFVYITFVFFCIVIIINFFEEIRFAEKYNAEIYFIIYLSLLNAPSLIYEIFPFIFLISVKFFYLNLVDKDELSIFNTNGVSNFHIMSHYKHLFLFFRKSIDEFFYILY